MLVPIGQEPRMNERRGPKRDRFHQQECPHVIHVAPPSRAVSIVDTYQQLNLFVNGDP
jgi:hypothetical protein